MGLNFRHSETKIIKNKPNLQNLFMGILSLEYKCVELRKAQ